MSSEQTSAQYAKTLFAEATVVGAVTMIIGIVIVSFLLYVDSVVYKEPAATSKTLLTIALSLFLTGFVAHFGFELLGINAWYLTNSAAAKFKKTV